MNIYNLRFKTGIMLFFEISIFASDVFVSKNRPKVMEFDFFGHGKSWNLNFQKEYEPWINNLTFRLFSASSVSFWSSVFSLSALIAE